MNMNVEMLKSKLENGELRYHHSASRRGYVSRKEINGVVETYNGKFGKGYMLLIPRWDTTQYVTVEYYVEV